MAEKSSKLFDILNFTLAVVGVLVVVSQIYLARSDFHSASKTQKAQLIFDLHKRAFGSELMKTTFQRLDYAEIKYQSPLIFKEQEDQLGLIEILSFFELLAKLNKLELLELDEIDKVFGYYIRQTFKNGSVSDYLADLKDDGRLTFPGFKAIGNKLKDKDEEN